MARLFTEGFEMGDVLRYTGRINGYYNSAFQRSGTYGCHFEYSSSIVQYLYEEFDSEKSEIYIRAAVTRFSDNVTTRFLSWRNNSTVLGSIQRNTDNSLSILVGSSVVATSEDVGFTNGNFTRYTDRVVEVHVKIHDSEGVIDVKYKGLSIVTYVGDTKPDANTGINRVYFQNDGGNGYIAFDDLAINDTSGTEDNSWCGDGHIILYKPNATGSATMLMGSDGDQTNNYALVDDIPYDGDSSYVYSGSPGYYDLYKLEDTSLPVNSVIRRIWIESRAKDPDTGYLKSVIQTASGSYTSGSVQMASSYDAQVYDVYSSNPSTGSGWTSDEIDYLQIGIQIAE